MRSEIFQKVIHYWKHDGIKLISPDTEQKIIRCFQKIKKPISKDVIEFYRLTSGMSDGEIDSEFIYFWNLEEILKENLKYKSEFALFADYSIHVFCYGFKYESPEISSVYIEWFDHYNPTKIAGSVEEFFDIYLKNPVKIFG